MKKNILYGAILGDLAGQPYEFPTMEFFPNVEDIDIHNPNSVFTDDTIMTLATAKAIMDNQSFEEAYKEVGSKYPSDHYGKDFKEWINSPLGTVGTSWGNGCLMRISPIMYLDIPKTQKKVLALNSCETSHKNQISIVYSLELVNLYENCYQNFDYFIKFDLNPFKEFKVKADETFEFCERAFFKYRDTSTHELIKKVISCGGDTDTNASIVGELMNYTNQDLTNEDIAYVESKLDTYLLDILHRFNKFINK